MQQGSSVVDQHSSLPEAPAGVTASGAPWLHRRPVRFLLDGLCGALAVMLAYALRFDMEMPRWAHHQNWRWTAILFVLDPLVIFAFGGDRSTWQHFGLRDLRLLGLRLGILNGVMLVISMAVQGRHFMPIGIVLMDLLLVL